MATIQQVLNNLKTRIDYIARESVDTLSKDVEEDARKNFNRARREVPADDPNVDVVRIKNSNYEYTIECGGTQVLFIEFGAGTKWFYKSSFTSEARGEIAPRPVGIVDVGNYGKHRGKDDAWFYKSEIGRESLHAHLFKHNRRGEPIMITSGIRPTRALWRARANALKKFTKKVDMWRTTL